MPPVRSLHENPSGQLDDDHRGRFVAAAVAGLTLALAVGGVASISNANDPAATRVSVARPDASLAARPDRTEMAVFERAAAGSDVVPEAFARHSHNSPAPPSTPP